MKSSENSTKVSMKNITINLPDNYEKNIQKLIKMKLMPSRSEAIRIALREFLQREYNENLDILEYFEQPEENNLNLVQEEKKIESCNY